MIIETENRNIFKSNCTNDDWKKFLDNITTPVLTSEKLMSMKEIWLRANCLNH